MRVGSNPAALRSDVSDLLSHRVIVPVYIPKLEGYFRHSLEILRLCLESLRRTARDRASVTVISNGCGPEVIAELNLHHQAGWIDQLLLHHSNQGKVDAVVAAARGAFEELVTIADSDVMFGPGWLEAVESLFRAFPECGLVSPSPNPGLCWYHTSATVLGGLARSELSFGKVVPDSDLERFARSIGWGDAHVASGASLQMMLRRNGAVACVGSGHFVFTIRKEVVQAIPKDPCRRSLQGSEERWLDIPPDAQGYWRLATPRAYAYHMGNVPEPWMYEQLDRCSDPAGVSPNGPRRVPAARRHWTGLIPWPVRRRLVRRFRPWVSRLAG
jgi:hypothetical protein